MSRAVEHEDYSLANDTIGLASPHITEEDGYMFTVDKGESIARAQANGATCWLACYQMMFKWKGISDDAEGIKERLKGVGIPMIVPAPDEDGALQKGLKGKYYPTANGSVGLQSLKGGELDSTELDYILRKKGPIWATMKFGSINHNIVVIGAGDGNVKYINPGSDLNLLKADIVTSSLTDFNKVLKHFNGMKGANACWP
jgi:hypothetical protein